MVFHEIQDAVVLEGRGPQQLDRRLPPRPGSAHSSRLSIPRIRWRCLDAATGVPQPLEEIEDAAVLDLRDLIDRQHAGLLAMSFVTCHVDSSGF